LDVAPAIAKVEEFLTFFLHKIPPLSSPLLL
jgi:hypothetical protein